MKHEEIVALAFSIADDSMLELITCHCVRAGADLYAIVNEQGLEVRTLEAADSAIEEAFEWLALRNLAELVPDPEGDLIRLKETS